MWKETHQENWRMMHNKSLWSIMSITPSPKWPNMRLLSSPHTSPFSGPWIPGKGQHNSFFQISRRNYIYWIVWLRNPTKFLRPLVLFFLNKQSSPFLNFAMFTSWILFGTRKLLCLASSATKAIMNS